MTRDELIDKLAAAPEGSRKMDVAIVRWWYELFGSPSVYDLLEIPESVTLSGWSTTALPLTTSIDAALPGENIVLARRRASGLWEAEHCRNGVEAMGKAHNEALARRIAALKSLAEEQP